MIAVNADQQVAMFIFSGHLYSRLVETFSTELPFYFTSRTNLLMWVPIQRSETRLMHPIFFALRTFCMQVTMIPDIVWQSTFKTHFASTFYTISGVKKKLQYFPLHFSGAEALSGMRRKSSNKVQVLCT